MNWDSTFRLAYCDHSELVYDELPSSDLQALVGVRVLWAQCTGLRPVQGSVTWHGRADIGICKHLDFCKVDISNTLALFYEIVQVSLPHPLVQSAEDVALRLDV